MTTASIVTHITDKAQLTCAVLACARSGIDRLYIIDNSPSADDMPDTDTLADAVMAEEKNMTVKTVRMENRGFGAGHNLAFRMARDSGSEFHLVLNADVCWEGDAVSPMTGYMKKNPDVVLMAPRILYPDGTLQYNARMLPTPLDLLLKRFVPSFLFPGRRRRYLLADVDHHSCFESPYLTGCFMLFRSDAFSGIGGFDERFFMYPEDIDITRRLHAIGRTLYWPEVTVIHDHAAASRRSAAMLRIHMINMIRYFNKWGWLSDPGRRMFNRKLTLNAPVADSPESGRG